MSTFAQETDQDLTLVEGQLVLVENVAEAAAIELNNKFRFVKGEYFLDIRQGVPYFDVVFVKNPDILIIRELFRKIILSARGITSVIDIQTSLDRQTRKLSFSFRTRAADGQIVSGGAGLPFIVEAG